MNGPHSGVIYLANLFSVPINFASATQPGVIYAARTAYEKKHARSTNTVNNNTLLIMRNLLTRRCWWWWMNFHFPRQKEAQQQSLHYLQALMPFPLSAVWVFMGNAARLDRKLKVYGMPSWSLRAEREKATNILAG
jgi:hypothetical protein